MCCGLNESVNRFWPVFKLFLSGQTLRTTNWTFTNKGLQVHSCYDIFHFVFCEFVVTGDTDTPARFEADKVAGIEVL